jgi:hypothetical protein
MIPLASQTTAFGESETSNPKRSLIRSTWWRLTNACLGAAVGIFGGGGGKGGGSKGVAVNGLALGSGAEGVAVSGLALGSGAERGSGGDDDPGSDPGNGCERGSGGEGGVLAATAASSGAPACSVGSCCVRPK